MINAVTLIGNLTKDPELRTTRQTGKSVCSFTIAVNDRGGGDNKAYYFPVVAWESAADLCGKYLRKGSKVGINGALTSRMYEDNEGKKHSVIEVLARSIDFLSPKDADQSNAAPTTAPDPAPAPAARADMEEIDEDLPF